MALYGRRRLIVDSGSIAAVTDRLAARPDLSASFHSTSTTGSTPLPNGCVFYEYDCENIEHGATILMRALDVAIYVEDVDWAVEPNYPEPEEEPQP
tara:strand:+ start:388 stop:675 length:288 start_codon:yes stop_codon:yes gene_type:complete